MLGAPSSPVAVLREATWPAQLQLLRRISEGEPRLAALAFDEVSQGGKHLRALVPLMAARALASRLEAPQEEAALAGGLAIELVHVGTLCHDDLMDGDGMRRGRAAAWRRLGTADAITLGDYLFYLADEALHCAPLEPARSLSALRLVSRSARALAEGQALENAVARSAELPTEAEYRRIAAGKSGALFGAALALGGLCAGADEATCSALEALGSCFGRTYQMADDLLDLIADKGRGEQARDLWEGKPSWLVLRAAQALPAAEREQLRELVYRERLQKTADDVRALRELLVASGAVARTREDVLIAETALLRRVSEVSLPLRAAIAPFLALVTEVAVEPAPAPHASTSTPTPADAP